MKLRKLLAFLFMGAVLAGGFCSCGDDDDDLTTNNTQGNQQQGNQQQGNQQQGNQQNQQQGSLSVASLVSQLKNTKWMAIFDRTEALIKTKPVNNNGELSFTMDTTYVDAHDTLYVDFGVDVDYPTYNIRIYDRSTNKRYNDLSMWFDVDIRYVERSDSLLFGFRSYPIGDPGTRKIYAKDGKYYIQDKGCDIELSQVK